MAAEQAAETARQVAEISARDAHDREHRNELRSSAVTFVLAIEELIDLCQAMRPTHEELEKVMSAESAVRHALAVVRLASPSDIAGLATAAFERTRQFRRVSRSASEDWEVIKQLSPPDDSGSDEKTKALAKLLVGITHESNDQSVEKWREIETTLQLPLLVERRELTESRVTQLRRTFLRGDGGAYQLRQDAEKKLLLEVDAFMEAVRTRLE
ncbi:hypothetical protein ACFT8P_14025 [Streptomyces sp. NPDC057101]|uniref:hypothetical protein n=1 Tax=Streptomyces sp. NPDC057101 TaxID=3346020 RepID=UPI0036451604